jgi:hypothetical protein
MAEVHTVPGTDVRVKPRNPVAVGFLSLTIVYIPFHWYFVNRELRDLGRARGIDLGSSPGVSSLAMALGWIVIVPPFWTAYTTGERVKNAQIYTGRKDWWEGWIGLVILLMLPPMMFGLIQDQLNKVWQNLGVPTPNEKQVLPPPYYPPQPGYPPQQQGYPPQPGYGAPPPPGHRPPEAPPPPPPPPA